MHESVDAEKFISRFTLILRNIIYYELDILELRKKHLSSLTQRLSEFELFMRRRGNVAQRRYENMTKFLEYCSTPNFTNRINGSP